MTTGTRQLLTPIAKLWPVPPSGQYKVSETFNGAAADVTPSVSAVLYLVPFDFERPTALSAIGIYLTTLQVGAAALVGVYDDQNGLPVNLIADGGSLDLSSGSGSWKEGAISCTVSGRVWGGVFLKNVATQATVKGCTSSNQVPAFPQTQASLIGSALRGWTLTTAYPASLTALGALSGLAAAAGVPQPMLKAA